MRALRNKTNVQAPNADFPFGRAKDNPGDNTGTPVDENLLGDILQFFEKLMLDAGIAMNNLPEQVYSGFQLNQSLDARINALSAIVVAAEAAIRAAADSTLQNNINTLDFTLYSPSAIAGSGAKNVVVIDLSTYSGANILLRVDVSARNSNAAGEGTWNEDVLSFRSNGGTLVQIGATQTLMNRVNGASAPVISYSISTMQLTVIGNSSSGAAIMTYRVRVQILTA